MSEQGWKAFLASADTQDWVVLHGGAAAFFALGNLSAAARLAQAIADLPELSGAQPLLTLSATGLAVRLTRDVWQLEDRDIAVARAISRSAAAHGAVPRRDNVQEVQLAIAARADTINLPFWRAVLGYAPMADDNAVDPLGHGSTVWMQQLGSEKPLRHAMHVDVSVAREMVHARLDAAVAAGGTIVDASHAPAHWTLSDAAGNRVCICAWPDSGGGD